MLDMWPWLLFCGGVAATLVLTYLLGVEVGKEKGRKS